MKPCAWPRNIFVLAVVALVVAGLQRCAAPRVQREIRQVSSIKDVNQRRTYLKVHMKQGDLYILYEWAFEEATRTITGFGNRLDHNRRIIDSRGATADNAKAPGAFVKYRIPMDGAVLVETNDKGTNGAVPAMVLVNLITVPISLLCIINPKSCFGSCPTFYIVGDSSEKVVAEGFSSSISRSLQETDVDLIDVNIPEGDDVGLVVKNEALETHMIRRVDMLSCEKQPGNKVIRDISGSFHEVRDIARPLVAQSGSVSILDKIDRKDQLEWYSLADSTDLSTKEDVFMEFERPDGDVGLIIETRQSLMTTYLFYHTMALMGTTHAYYMSEMETRKAWMKKWINRMYDRLGGIEVFIKDPSGRWQFVNEVREAGPIVSDVHLVGLPSSKGKTISIRLRMAKGLWRINKVGLGVKVREVIPERFAPVEITRKGIPDTAALNRLVSRDNYLVTWPGDELVIRYPLQSRPDRQLFIESEGYYIEWMREDWLKEQDLVAYKKMMLNPGGYLRKMAPLYKMTEPKMEEVFWNSRYTNLEE